MNKQKFYTGYGLLSVVLMVLLMFSSLPAMAEKYWLFIADTEVTDANCNNLKDIKGVTVAPGGEFKYTPASKTLTMTGVTVSNESGYAISNYIEGLTIVVSGSNRLEATDWSALQCYASTTIEGSGSLTITSSNVVAIFAKGATLTVSDITLEATGKRGIAGFNGNYNETLIIKNATVNAKGSEAAIANFKTFSLRSCQIIAPVGAKWKDEKKAVVDAGGNKAKEVKIESAAAKKYELYIAGTQVTDANCNDLRYIDDVVVDADSEFKYDPATKTLTMKGITLSVGDGKNAIRNVDIAGLTIEVLGTNSLTSTRSSALSCGTFTKIKGSGSLTIESNSSVAIYVNNKLTVSNIELEATGKWGIAGRTGNEENLVIENAEVSAKGTEAAIADFKTVTLEGCGIIAPEGAEWKADQHAVVDAQGNVAKEVKIVTKYNLYIAGTQVTSLNCNALKDIKGVTVASGGVFKYDPTKKTLTMKGVTVSVENDENAIWNSSIEGLKIRVLGTNSLKTTGATTLNCHASTEIEGNGSLTIASASDRAAVFVGNTTLTISDITLEATGAWGFVGYDGHKNTTLIIKNATVTANGTAAAIGDLKTFTLEGCRIIAPEGAEWKAEKKAVVDAGGNVAKEVKIAPIEKYELYIARTQVTADNCNNLKDITGVTVAEGGEFKYDPDKKTLTMKDVTVSVSGDNQAILNSGIEGLTITVSGTNSLTTAASTLSCRVSTKLEGNGSLSIESHTNAAIFANGTTLTVSDITLEATGNWGIVGDDGSNETLIIKNAKVNAKGKEAAIADLKTFTLEGCRIIAPEGGKFNEEKHAVVDAEGYKAKEVKIAPIKKYELYIAGTQVTDANCNNLKDITGVTVAAGGVFKYDPGTKTLTMKEVTVSVGKDEYAIWNKSIEGLEIVISGSNRLEATDQSPLNCLASTKIEGSGSLTTTSTESSCINIYKTTLTISNITLETTGVWGITGFAGDKNETLIIKKATVTAKGKEAAIAYLKTFTLEGCQIIAPDGGKWNDEKKAVVDAGGNVAKEVKIEKVAVVAVTGVKVMPTTVDLKVTETQKLTVTVEPNNATNKNYTCKSDNEGVATVDNTGLVTAVGVGTATITITTEEGKKTAQCTVNVSESGSPSFALSATTLNVPAAGGAPSVNVTSDKAWTLDYDSSVTWLKTSPKAGAGSQAVTFTVEKNEASAPRTVVVTFKQAETEKELQLTITQGTTASVHVSLQGISFTESALKLKVGTSTTLVVKYNPENATNKKVTWEVTEGAASLSVDANSGKITATNVVGTAKVKATSEDGGHTAECTITVTTKDVPVESIAVSPAVVNLTVGGTEKLSVSVNPRTATNKAATWAVTVGADIVSVDGSGLVRALKEGTATVTATVGGKTATCTVNVTAAPAPLAVEDAVLASVVVAPNPFTSQLRIVNPEGIALRYELVTLTGNVVRAGALDGTETMVDTEALPAGLYFVRLTGQNGAKKVVKVVKY